MFLLPPVFSFMFMPRISNLKMLGDCIHTTRPGLRYAQCVQQTSLSGARKGLLLFSKLQMRILWYSCTRPLQHGCAQVDWAFNYNCSHARLDTTFVFSGQDWDNVSGVARPPLAPDEESMAPSARTGRTRSTRWPTTNLGNCFESGMLRDVASWLALAPSVLFAFHPGLIVSTETFAHPPALQM